MKKPNNSLGFRSSKIDRLRKTDSITFVIC
jgi:hypothetical protein